jgi:hypothetical protein
VFYALAVHVRPTAGIHVEDYIPAANSPELGMDAGDAGVIQDKPIINPATDANGRLLEGKWIHPIHNQEGFLILPRGGIRLLRRNGFLVLW